MEKIKKGIKTSEFWFAVVAALIPVFNKYFGWNLDTVDILSIAGVVATYVFGRSKVKSL